MNQHTYKNMSTLARFLTKVNKAGPVPAHRPELGPCWLWTAGTQFGYGKFSLGVGQMVPAHRWHYEQVKGPIPRELATDHLCRNKACVNPEHLEPCTHKVNILRGEGPSAKNARKVTCDRGHEFKTRQSNGKTERYCPTCAKIANRITLGTDFVKKLREMRAA